MTDLLEIEGARGEGGGQILRTALTLSLATGRPFRMVNVRANRPKPGLLAQHLTCIRAAEAVAADARLRARRFHFTPGAVRGGTFEFDIGTAGSVGLVLQTILPNLLAANEPSAVTLRGGTHNSAAPSFDFLERVFVPELRRAGADVALELLCHGFYPAGGGSERIVVTPGQRLSSVELLEPAEWKVTRVTAVVARLPSAIAEREIEVVAAELHIPRESCEFVIVDDSAGPGNILSIELASGPRRELVVGFGQRGIPAEQVARDACREAQKLIDTRAPVGPHLADQLILPLALNAGGRFLTSKPTLHTQTNLETVQLFLPVAIHVTPRDDGLYEITIDV